MSRIPSAMQGMSLTNVMRDMRRRGEWQGEWSLGQKALKLSKAGWAAPGSKHTPSVGGHTATSLTRERKTPTLEGEKVNTNTRLDRVELPATCLCCPESRAGSTGQTAQAGAHRASCGASSQAECQGMPGKASALLLAPPVMYIQPHPLAGAAEPPAPCPCLSLSAGHISIEGRAGPPAHTLCATSSFTLTSHHVGTSVCILLGHQTPDVPPWCSPGPYQQLQVPAPQHSHVFLLTELSIAHGHHVVLVLQPQQLHAVGVPLLSQPLAALLHLQELLQLLLQPGLLLFQRLVFHLELVFLQQVLFPLSPHLLHLHHQELS